MLHNMFLAYFNLVFLRMMKNSCDILDRVGNSPEDV